LEKMIVNDENPLEILKSDFSAEIEEAKRMPY
jgi:hypothetical protein